MRLVKYLTLTILLAAVLILAETNQLLYTQSILRSARCGHTMNYKSRRRSYPRLHRSESNIR